MRHSPYLKSFILLALFSFTSAHAQADSVIKNKECLINAIESATDDLTIGELKAKCETQQIAEPSAVAERIELDKEHTLEPFTIMSHRPNYLLFAAYNEKGYSKSFQQALNETEERLDDTEAQFQLSLKVPLATSIFDKNVDIYGAYTVRSFWQVYNSEESAPFRETNHEPEGLATNIPRTGRCSA